jgi:hypothetical protein
MALRPDAPASRSAARLPSYPPLWPARQCRPQGQRRSRPCAVRGAVGSWRCSVGLLGESVTPPAPGAPNSMTFGIRLARIRLNGLHSLTVAISCGPPRVCGVRTPFSSSSSRPATIAAAEAPVTPCRPFGSLRDRCPAARDALYRARGFPLPGGTFTCGRTPYSTSSRSSACSAISCEVAATAATGWPS